MLPGKSMNALVTPKDSVHYDHSRNRHSTSDARTALPVIFPDGVPRSVLDVGCGTGTWLHTIAQAGTSDCIGVDGVDVPATELLIERERFIHRDLTIAWDLGRRFEAVLCLEVAEHLPPESAGTLLDALVLHSDLVIFSAACAGQPGQNHLNCQWPSYWQALFNARGYACNDEVRWRLWDLDGIDAWYKQNMFVARHAPSEAGREPRLRSVVHPEMISYMSAAFTIRTLATQKSEIQDGLMPNAWYFDTLVRAFRTKVRRKLDRLFRIDKVCASAKLPNGDRQSRGDHRG